MALVVLGALLFGAVAWYGSSQLIHPPRRRPAVAPADYGLESESISFQSRDGITLRGWFVSAPNAKGIILLCHGFAGECSADLKYAPIFVQAGFEVMLFDFRGHGMSDGRGVSLVFLERQDLQGALDFLAARGRRRVGLLGFSMGGAVAISGAAGNPAVVGVVADSGFASLKEVIRARATVHGLPRRLAGPVARLVVWLAGLRLHADLAAADPVRWIGQIAPRPVLIMHAGDDVLVPVVAARELYRAARDPKELWIVEGATHREIEKVAPVEYLDRVIDFFRRAFDQDA